VKQLAVAVALSMAVIAQPVSATAQSAVATDQASGITVVSDEALSDRLHELTVVSDALEGEARLRVLLPTGHDPAGDVDHPVLFLLHGCCDDYRAWTDKSDLEAFTAAMDLIVVMPDAGAWGFYTDWFNNGALGQPKWESHHVGELVGWIGQQYDACDRRACRIVIGLSMGGFGSLSYAARHPDLFVAAAAFSGAVDTTLIDPAGGTGLSLVELFLGNTLPGSVWGQYATEEVRWRGHNPHDLATNLAHTELELRTGNGQPGGEYGGNGIDPLEVGVHQMMANMHQQLAALGIGHVWDDYGPGAHDWPYWERDLHLTLPTFLDVIAEDRRDPEVISHRFIEPRLDVWGWRVELERDVLEFAELRDASADGFVLVGTGSATVTTPPRYVPGRTHEVDVDGTTMTITAGPDGRLVIPVDLGPSNQFQQYTPLATALEAAAGDAYLTTARVTIAAAAVLGPGEPPAQPSPPGEGMPATGGGAVVAVALVVLGALRTRRRP